MITTSFTTDWFSSNIPVWTEVLGPLAHQPNLSFVEIGSWEGRSACWLLQHILTHPSSRLTCIDTFPGADDKTDPAWREQLIHQEERFRQNVEAAGGTSRVRVLKAESASALPHLPAESFDCAYVDGSHDAADVLKDIIHCWLLLKPGGILICDDYHWNPFGHRLQSPEPAIDSFLHIFEDRYDLLHNAYQIILKKRIPHSPTLLKS